MLRHSANVTLAKAIAIFVREPDVHAGAMTMRLDRLQRAQQHRDNLAIIRMHVIVPADVTG